MKAGGRPLVAFSTLNRAELQRAMGEGDWSGGSIHLRCETNFGIRVQAALHVHWPELSLYRPSDKAWVSHRGVTFRGVAWPYCLHFAPLLDPLEATRHSDCPGWLGEWRQWLSANTDSSNQDPFLARFGNLHSFEVTPDWSTWEATDFSRKVELPASLDLFEAELHSQDLALQVSCQLQQALQAFLSLGFPGEGAWRKIEAELDRLEEQVQAASSFLSGGLRG